MSTLLTFVLAVCGMTNIMIYSNFPLVSWMRGKVNSYRSDNPKVPDFVVKWTGENGAMKYLEAKDYLFAKLKELFSCSMCMGWWVGLLMAVLIYPVGWATLPLAFAGSFVGRSGDLIQSWLETHIG